MKTPNIFLRFIQVKRGRRLYRYSGDDISEINQKVKLYYQSPISKQYYGTLAKSNHWKDMCRRKGFIALCNSAKCIVDYGCGAGDLSLEISNHFPGKQVIALDIGEYSGQLIRKSPKNVKFSRCDLIYAPLYDRTADLVISRFSIEHTTYPELYLKEIFRILKPNGHLYLLYPHLLLKVSIFVVIQEVLSWFTSSRRPTYLEPQIGSETYYADDQDAVWLSNSVKIRRMLYSVGFKKLEGKPTESLFIAHKKV